MNHSAQRIIANDRSMVLGAVLDVDVQRHSTDIRMVSESRQGRGTVALTGPYSGAADTVVDVEILSGSGTALRPSAPALVGVGSGSLTVLSLDAGASAERLTLRLISDGDPSTNAELAFFGATLMARADGAAGNILEMNVARNLSFVETQWSTLDDINSGTSLLNGPQWDWGAAAAIDNRIPATAPRITFRGSPQVHRHWRSWQDGMWTYHIDPPTVGSIGKGTRIMAVSGNYTLTLTDGSVTETYNAITVYDALRQIAARSSLVYVVGIVAEDRAPGGMAVTDIPLYTDAYVLSVEATIQGPYGVPRLDDVVVNPGAPTETVTITRQGSGIWGVVGSVSGDFPSAFTGVPYGAGPVQFVIPPAIISPGDQAAIIGSAKLVSRNEDEDVPAICVYPRLGQAATPKQITFVYTPRGSSCDCTNLIAPFVSDSCLGLKPAGGSMTCATTTLPVEVTSRIADIYAWREGFIRDNTGSSAGTDPVVIPGTTIVGSPAVYEVTGTIKKEPSSFYFKAYFTLNETWAEDDVASATSVAVSLSQNVSYLGGQSPAVGETVTIAGRSATITGLGQAVTETLGATVNARAQSSLRPAVPDVFVPGTTIPGAPPSMTANAAIIGWMDSAIGILHPCLLQSYQEPAALTAWDAFFAEVQSDLTIISNTGASPSQDYLRRYRANCDNIRILAGIYPSFNGASSEAGACWQDDGGDYWWLETTGEYLPAFTSKGYASAKRIGDEVIMTHEFGFGLAIGCPDDLKDGDAVTIIIRGANYDGYGSGDQYRLHLVSATSPTWAGGVDGDPTHVWVVDGSASGSLPDWEWNPVTPADYTAGNYSLRMLAGGIPYAVGDTWTVDIEGGLLRWRRDAGAWTTEDLYGTAPDLTDGLELNVLGGSAPSFVAGDTWQFKALATYGPDRLRQPREGRYWAWDGKDAVLDIDLGAIRSIEAVLIALHTLPSGAGISIEGGIADVTDWDLTPTWRDGPILALPESGTQARYLRLTLSECGSGASIGWVWAGTPWTPTTGVSDMVQTRQYGVSRSVGRNPVGLYRGRGTGGRWAWSLDAGGALLPGDVVGLIAMLDHVTVQGLEWVCLVPDVSVLTSATMAQIDADEVQFVEHLGYALDGESLVSVDLPFRAVLM